MMYTIQKEIYIDSNTRDISQLKNIEIIFEYVKETRIKLTDIFLPGDKEKGDGHNTKFWVIFFICLGVIILLSILVCRIKFRGSNIKDFGGIEESGYKSLE